MNPENSFLLYKIAKYYYIDQYSQQEISEKVNLSRPQISRMLKKAHEVGIVDIRVSLPNTLTKVHLAEKLTQLLKLKEVILTPSSTDPEKNDRALYFGAAAYLKEELKDKRHIGIGWGETLYNISLHLSYCDDKKERIFYALAGTSGTNNPYFQTNSIVDRFAERFHAHAYYNNFPSYIETDRFSALESKRWNALERNWRKLDTIVVGLAGIAKIDQLYPEEFQSPDLLKEIVKEMKGDILANFFNNTTVYQFPDHTRISSLDMAQIHNLKNVICIAHGEPKVDAIISASTQGYIKKLITDEDTGRMIFEKINE